MSQNGNGKFVGKFVFLQTVTRLSVPDDLVKNADLVNSLHADSEEELEKKLAGLNLSIAAKKCLAIVHVKKMAYEE